MADVYFSKTEVVISQPWIEICRLNLVADRVWPSEGSDVNKYETGSCSEQEQEAQLSQRHRATLRVIEYFAKSLKVIRNRPNTVE